MAVSIEQLRGFTREIGFAFDELTIKDTAGLAVRVPTETPSGVRELTVYARSYDDGEMFEVIVAGFIPTELNQKSNYKLEFLFYLLHKAWDTKLGTPEVDEDGEVRLLVEIPLMDAAMTARQFEYVLRVASSFAVEIAIEGARVLTDGAMPPSFGQNGDGQLQQAVAAMAEMVGSAEGLGRLKQIAEDEDAPEQLRTAASDLLRASSRVPNAL